MAKAVESLMRLAKAAIKVITMPQSDIEDSKECHKTLLLKGKNQTPGIVLTSNSSP